MEIDVPPDVAATICIFGAIVLIDVAFIKAGRASASCFIRHNLYKHPVITLTCAVALGAHLALEIRLDPLNSFGRLARTRGAR